MYKLHELEKPILFSNTERLHYVSFHHFEQDWTKGTEHSHRISELFFCLKGHGTFSVQGQTLPVEPMDFIYLDPFVKHTEWSSQDDPLEYVCLGISGVHLFRSGQKDGFYKDSFRDAQELMLPCLSAIVSEMANQEKGYEELCGHLMSVILLYLKRKTTLVDAPRPNSAAADNYTMAWVHQYLEDNSTKDINLEALAEKVNINKYSLIRNFQKTYGVTPIEYVLQLRFNDAKMLLKNTDHPIFQIAFHLGFSSSSYFSQCFQRREGLSPSEYRLRSRQEVQECP